jgi:hypothetical protein
MRSAYEQRVFLFLETGLEQIYSLLDHLFEQFLKEIEE